MKTIPPAQERKTLSIKSLKTVKGYNEDWPTFQTTHPTTSPTKPNPALNNRVRKPRSPRQVAREMAAQCLYHGLVNPNALELIIAQVIMERKRQWRESLSIQEQRERRTAQDMLPQELPVNGDVENARNADAPRTMGALLGGAPARSSLDEKKSTNQHHLVKLRPKSPQDKHPEREDRGFFRHLIDGAWAQREGLIAALSPHLDRKIEEVSPMVLSILILGAYELAHNPVTPVQVILNEAIELSKRFGAETAHRYVNGVLEKIAKEVREAEMSQVGESRRLAKVAHPPTAH